jgi:hypothetical protein
MNGSRPRPIPPDDPYLGLAALGRVCGMSIRTLRDRIHDAVTPLPAYRVGRGKLLVRRSEFDAWMAKRRYAPATIEDIVENVLRDLAGKA